MPGNIHQLFHVTCMLGRFTQNILIEFLECLGGAVGLKCMLAQGHQHLLTHVNRGCKDLTINICHTQIYQLVSVNAIKGAGKYLQVGEMLFSGGDNFQYLFALINGHDQNPGRAGARRFKQIDTRSIAIEKFETKLAKGVNLFGVMIENDRLEAPGLQHAPHGHAKSAVTGDNDRRAAVNLVCRSGDRSACEERLDELFLKDHEGWRQCHGEGHHGHKHCRLGCRQQAKAQSK